MVRQVLIFFIFFSQILHAQDERYYRQILTGELPKALGPISGIELPSFNAYGNIYRLDINGDGIEESIQPQKRDGVDWIEIRDSSQRKVFEAKLLAQGAESYLYKIRLVSLSTKARALILFLDEGFTKGKYFESTAKIYLVSLDNNDLSTLKISDGAHFFHEKKAQRELYWRRIYNVNVFDMDNDGIKDISVQYNNIQRIFRYLGNGNWDKF